MAASDEDISALVEQVRAFCDRHGIAESTFGRHAVNDGKLVSRIAGGSWIEAETSQRVHNFMARVDAGEVVLRGRPRRKKADASAEKMAELISTESSVRTPGSFAFHEQRQRFHVFANTTNESWVVADRVALELAEIEPGPDGFRLLYTPMDNGIILTRTLRALHALHPDVPVLVVMKGRGLEDLRNTMGRLVDRLAEHPLSVFVMTNLYLSEAVDLSKRSDDNPADVVWRDMPLVGERAYDFQGQLAALYSALSQAWLIHQGPNAQPVYAEPSVVAVYRQDQRDALKAMLPVAGDDRLKYNYALLNHPYLHSHTMTFRLEHVLEPVFHRLADHGRMTVIQGFGQDPAHDIVSSLWPDQASIISRYDVIRAFRRALADESFSVSGLTDTHALFRFDMHTLPVLEDQALGTQSLSTAFNNAIYFAQVREELAQAAIREGRHYLEVTDDILRRNGGLWFVNESFSVTRKPA
ncbi:MAG: hypothetical protein AAF499_06620 [Pseudomonadota bacterium]